MDKRQEYNKAGAQGDAHGDSPKEAHMEKIGQVTLDYTYYPGEDQYSDGGIEDEMLRIAMECKEDEFEDVIVRSKSWPVLYHFSHVRQNIIDWLPMTGQESVLEIGAGPGAITGALVKKARQVTCIDLSRKRSLINAYRHRDCGNLRLLVGNFQDIERSLEERFDLITLIGVFEYAQYSIQAEDPFVEYLRRIRRHLKPGGRLVIAIENRLGLKYWAGATEDHTGVYFEGLEGYPTTDYVRTFSKPELEAVLRQAGFENDTFYYPYPDYKLSEKLYSDAYLPKRGELNHNRQNLDRERIQVFSEERVYDSLTGSGLFPQFSNSFFAVCKAADDGMTLPVDPRPDVSAADSQVLFTKYSNERDRRFRIRTDILEENGARLICKTAQGPEAAAHIAHIYDSYLALKKDLAGTSLSVNECVPETGRIAQGETRGEEMPDIQAADVEHQAAFRPEKLSFPWLSGRTLEEELDGLLQSHRLGEVKEKIRDYLALFSDCDTEFVPTPEFAEVFGNVSFARPQKSRAVSDIDMIFSNVIETENGRELIDYEWTFDFPVPLRFLHYRCLHYYAQGNAARAGGELDERRLMEEFDITGDEQRQFAAMERSFQKYILGGYRPIWKLYDDISDGVIEIAPLVAKESLRKKHCPASVWFDTGNGFSEEGRREYPLARTEGTTLEIELPEGTKALRLKPYSGRCLVRLKAVGQEERTLAWTSNGSPADNGDLIFDTDDPQIEIETQGDAPVQISFGVEPLTGFARELILNQHGRIRWMEQTKAWRLYRKLRGSKQI